MTDTELAPVHDDPVDRKVGGPPVDPPFASVLLVVDDRDWLTAMRGPLAGESIQVVTDTSGESAFDDEAARRVDAAIIDLGLMARSGLAVCAALRTRSNAPIVATSADADEATVLAAFAAGADQFALLSTSPRQFVARLRSLLRRPPPRRVPVEEVPVGPIILDADRRAVVVHGVPLVLSDQEYLVLAALMARPGRVVSRNELLGDVSTARSDRALDFVIRRLRQKLEETDTRRRIIAIRGVGFRFEADDLVGGVSR
jgi:DNA-binding response OmpR family regulator